MRKTGTYQTLGNLDYFVPYALPPETPPLELTPEIMALYGDARAALGQLNGICAKLPDPQRFIKAYVIKEALLSSAIEGIHATLIEVFTQPLSAAKANKETQLILNYTKALDTALNLLKNQGLPIVSRVILKAHETLMSNGQGDRSTPGVYRKQSVRVGNLIPPPAPAVPRLMSELEQYINEPSEMPALIKAGLAHVQFETIHPFLDGNGRIGRLIIVLMLIDSGLLDLPILYPSYYFKKHHFEYYQKLDRVRSDGDFEGWIIYYLTAIRDSALDAYTRAKDIEALETKLKDIILADQKLGNTKETALNALEFLFAQPITSVVHMSKALNKAYNTAQKILLELTRLGIVSENIVHKRNKLYHFDAYLAVLEKEYRRQTE